MTQYQLETLYTELIKLKKDFRNNKINHEDTIVYIIETVIDLVVHESKKRRKVMNEKLNDLITRKSNVFMNGYNEWLNNQLSVYKDLFMKSLIYNGKKYYIYRIVPKYSDSFEVSENESGWFGKVETSLHFELVANFGDVIELPCVDVYKHIIEGEKLCNYQKTI